jgi:superfamily II DNA or RNA helicase
MLFIQIISRINLQNIYICHVKIKKNKNKTEKKKKMTRIRPYPCPRVLSEHRRRRHRQQQEEHQHHQKAHMEPYKKEHDNDNNNSCLCVTTKLLSHQQYVVDKLKDDMRPVLLSMVMGSGKTLTSIQLSVMMSGEHPTLFLTVPNVVDHIVADITKHTNIVPHVVTLATYISTDSRLLVCSYNLLTQLSDEHALFQRKYNIIFDEIHMIVNRSKTINVIKTIQRGQRVIGLSGTPRNTTLKKQLSILGSDAHLFFVDVTPPSVPITIVSIVFPVDVQQAYQKRRGQLSETDATTTSSRPSYTVLNDLRKLLSTSRTLTTVEVLSQLPACDKTVVVSTFSSVVTSLALCLPNCLLLNSSVNVKKRRQVIQKFLSDKSTKYLLTTSSVIGVGIDLGFTNTIVVAEPSYTVEQTKQLLGRITRVGQSPSGSLSQRAYVLMYENSLESRLHQSNIVIDISSLSIQ